MLCTGKVGLVLSPSLTHLTGKVVAVEVGQGHGPGNLGEEGEEGGGDVGEAEVEDEVEHPCHLGAGHDGHYHQGVAVKLINQGETSLGGFYDRVFR